MEGLMMIILLCLLLCLGSVCLASVLPPKLASGPSNSHESQIKTRLGPEPAPKVSPKNHGSVANPPTSHHRSIPHAVTPTSYSPPQKQDCDEILCSDPFTLSPIGSPCGCVFPMQVVVDLGVAPYRLFTRIPDLEVQVAAGTFLKQSQVKIMGANSSIRDQEKTMVTIYLVPLGEKFDSMSALLIYERFWQKKVPIDMSIFGDYEVIYVNYPGLPSSPPSKSGSLSGFGPSGTGSQQYPFTANVPSGTSQKMNSIIVVVIAVSSFILVFICLGVVFIILKWKKLGRLPTAGGSAVTMSVAKRPGIKSITSSSMTSLMSESLVSTMATCPSSVKLFSLVELEKATEKFSSKKILGEGGFGRVYDGIMEDGSKVAVKLLTKEDKYKDREFIAEVEVLSRLHHRNLVKLIGICIEGRKRCLVYELVANGSVESHLHDAGKGNLDWDARKKIALGAARGLAYLHEDSNPRVIHRDFKASNILLDEDFTPKVSDFGLAREASEGSHHISTRVMGTFGYVAPEYAMTGHLLVKSDVYSYGVVLLELLSGRKPVYISQPEGVENLVTWARPLLNSREGLEQLIDPSLDGSYNLDEMAQVATIASMCVHVETSQRPFMGEVVQALKLIYDTEGSLNSPRESSSGVVDFDLESSWGAPRLTYGYASSFMTMGYDSDPVEQTHWLHSMSCLVGRVESRLYRSGPLSTRTQESVFYRLKGSMSEHGSSLTRSPPNLSING